MTTIFNTLDGKTYHGEAPIYQVWGDQQHVLKVDSRFVATDDDGKTSVILLSARDLEPVLHAMSNMIIDQSRETDPWKKAFFQQTLSKCWKEGLKNSEIFTSSNAEIGTAETGASELGKLNTPSNWIETWSLSIKVKDGRRIYDMITAGQQLIKPDLSELKWHVKSHIRKESDPLSNTVDFVVDPEIKLGMSGSSFNPLSDDREMIRDRCKREATELLCDKVTSDSVIYSGDVWPLERLLNMKLTEFVKSKGWPYGYFDKSDEYVPQQGLTLRELGLKIHIPTEDTVNYAACRTIEVRHNQMGPQHQMRDTKRDISADHVKTPKITFSCCTQCSNDTSGGHNFQGSWSH